MALSGDTSWVLTRDEMITAALFKLGALADGQSASATQVTRAAQALNATITLLQTKGMPLWKRTETTVTLVDGTSSYTISNAVKIAAVYVVASNTQWELQNHSRYDQLELPTTSGGVPTNWSATPTLNDQTLRIWPTPDSTAATNYTLKVVYQKKFDDFTAAGENPDFPSYWMQAVIYHLAVALAPEYGVPLEDRKVLRSEAKEYLEMASGYGDEDGSFKIQPERWC